MKLRNLEELTKISGRNDIGHLYEEYAMRSELSFIRQMTIDESGYQMWLFFHQENKRTQENLYHSIIKSSLTKILNILKNYEDIIDISNVSKTIEQYMKTNVSMLLHFLLQTEMRNYDGGNEVYLQVLGDNYEKFKNLVMKYPYWYYLIKKFVNDTQEFFIEFFNQLADDQITVMMQFFGTVSKINDLGLSMGDRHKGRFVIEIKTDEGNFFYKPRTAEVDEAFKKCLEVLSRCKDILEMKAPDFVSRKNYSWFNKITYTPLVETDNSGYYQRLGQLLAIIYILNGNDIHFENLISKGDQPIIIDVETILTNRLMNKKSSASSYLQNDGNSYSFDSVQSSLMLPGFITIKNRHYDLSPIQILNKDVKTISKDTNHLVNIAEMTKLSNIVCQGFIAIYKEILNNKSKYKTYFTEIFKNIKVRFLNKPTSVYGEIRDLLTNPVCLFDSSYAFALSTKVFDMTDSVIKQEELFEQEELLKFDIPYFEIEANSKDLILSEERKIIDCFIETPLESLFTKIDILGEKDLEKQLSIIRQSFLVSSSDFIVKELGDVRQELKVRNAIIEDKSAIDDRIQNFIDNTVKEVFEQKLINPFTNQYFWIGPISKEEEGNIHYQVMDFPSGYYMGNVGILRTLLSLRNSEDYKVYIDKLIKDIEMEIDQLVICNSGELELSAYNGLTSFLRYYVDLYRVSRIDLDFFKKRVGQLLEQVEQNIDTDQSLDVLNGTAGAALSILSVNQLIATDSHLSEKINKILEHCRRHLLNSIRQKDNELFFPLKENKNNYMTGFSHGSSGIILALHKISKVIGTNDDMIIQKLLETERQLYNSEQKVWYRGNKTDQYSWAWCHGIPGILLSRIELYLDGYCDSRLVEEIRELYDITIEKSLGFNLTYCHGDLGNIIICKYVQKILNIEDTRIDDYLESILIYILESKNYHVKGTESVSLMVGLMGLVTFLDNFILQKNLNSIELMKITPVSV